MKRIVLRAPASIANFGPGFDIFAIALEKPHDIMGLTLNDSGAVKIRIVDGDDDIPCSADDNSAGIAAVQFFKKIKESKGVDVEIKKRMRSCAGLGTSGASAAACVYGLNKLLNADLSTNDLIEIARQGETATGGAAHADNVAGCLLGGFVIIKSDVPLIVDRTELMDIPIVISVRKKTQKTTRVMIPEYLPLAKAKDQMACCASLVHAVLSRDLKRIGEAVNTDHISEPVRSRFIPGYDALKKRVLGAGAYGFNVSGGGSSVFAICEKDKTSEIAEILSVSSRQQGGEDQILITRSSNKGVMEIDESEKDEL